VFLGFCQNSGGQDSFFLRFNLLFDSDRLVDQGDFEGHACAQRPPLGDYLYFQPVSEDQGELL